MKEIDDGGPAFPVYGGDSLVPDTGMTLRDWFAGMAMKALMQRESYMPMDGEMGGYDTESLATDAYWAADAMLYERSAHQKQPAE